MIRPVGTATAGLAEELVAWVAATAGGTVVDVRRQARWRPTYFIDVAAPAVETTVLKMARAPRHVIERSALLSTFNTEREALVLRGLQDSDVRVPPYLGIHSETAAMLMRKVDGSAQVHVVSDPVQLRTLARDFAEQIAALHRVDIAPVARAGDLVVHANAQDVALANFLAFAETDFDTVLRRRPGYTDPLLALARAWAHDRFPPLDRPTCLVQGDCGPDQFLFAGDKVTAVIDWELAHLGDPMVDLGAIRLRECLYPAGMFPIVLERYRELGMPVDEQAIRYYTVVTILFTLFGTIGGTARLDPRNDEVIQQLWWQVSLRRALCEAIAEWEGIDLTVPEWDANDDRPDVRLHALLGDRIHQLALRSPAWAGELRSTLALADGITSLRRSGESRDAADRADLEVCLGRAFADVADGRRALEDGIRTDPFGDLGHRLRALHAMAVREQVAWLPLMRADRWSEDEGGAGEDLRADHTALGLEPLGSGSSVA
jgi:aminoglycoside phosphotransferase (APT) family kinase protein